MEPPQIFKSRSLQVQTCSARTGARSCVCHHQPPSTARRCNPAPTVPHLLGALASDDPDSLDSYDQLYCCNNSSAAGHTGFVSICWEPHKSSHRGGCGMVSKSYEINCKCQPEAFRRLCPSSVPPASQSSLSIDGVIGPRAHHIAWRACGAGLLISDKLFWVPYGITSTL